MLIKNNLIYFVYRYCRSYASDNFPLATNKTTLFLRVPHYERGIKWMVVDIIKLKYYNFNIILAYANNY